MSTIEVTCNCGRVYVLPGDKEGRKLQCRRCGAVITIRRDAEPGVLVPFRTPTDDDDEGTRVDSPPKSKPAAPKPAGWGAGRLELKPLDDSQAPLRRCPKCGLQDDPTIVICIRCSFDFRDLLAPNTTTEGMPGIGALPPPPTPVSNVRTPVQKPLGRPSTVKITKAELSKAERAQDERIARVETLAKVSFIPLLGIAPGTIALVLSMVGNGPVRELPAPSRKAVESRLGTARLMAVATLLIWLGVVAFYAFIYLPQQKHEIRENQAASCKAHFQTLGRWINEARGEKGRFPADAKKTLADGILDLADHHGASETLSCPLLGGERYAIDGGLAAVLPTTNREYLIVWDASPHAEPDGVVKWFALRADGQLEEFRTAALFDKARTRPSEAAVAVNQTGSSSASNGNGSTGQGSGGPRTPQKQPIEGFEPKRTALIALAKDLDGRDPKLQKTITEDELAKKVGLAPADLITQVLRYGDDDLRHVAARVIARLDLPGPELLRLAEQLGKDADVEARWTLMLGLKRAGVPAWLDACAALAAETGSAVSDRALGLISDEALSGKDGLKRVLLRARDRRAITKAGSDQAIFVLPADVYPTLAQLLDDRDVGAEALGVLSRGGPEVEAVIEPLFASTDSRVRELAFRALRSNLGWREASRQPLHDKLKAEKDRRVKEAILPLLTDTLDTETMKRALEVLREATGDSVAGVARKILSGTKDKDALAEMLRELDKPGPCRDEVLSELRKPQRILDESVSEVIFLNGLTLQPAGQETALGLAFLRVDDVGHRFILRAATQSTSAAVREAAWKLFVDGARYSDKLRSEIQEEIVTRLTKEPEINVKAHIFALLGKYEFRTPQSVTTCEALARKTTEPQDVRERAVIALGQSTDPRAPTSIADVIDMLKDHPKYVASLKLREYTGATTMNYSSGEWRKLLKENDAAIRRKLKDRDDADRMEFKVRQEQAEQRARELRPRPRGGE